MNDKIIGIELLRDRINAKLNEVRAMDWEHIDTYLLRELDHLSQVYENIHREQAASDRLTDIAVGDAVWHSRGNIRGKRIPYQITQITPVGIKRLEDGRISREGQITITRVLAGGILSDAISGSESMSFESYAHYCTKQEAK